MATKITEHFSLEEMSATSHADLQQINFDFAKSHLEQLKPLCELLEQVRSVLGCPLIVSSGIRCPELNERVGGAQNSQHMRCEAADVVPSRHTVEEAFGFVHNSDIAFDQLILERSKGKTWLHISCSHAPRKESLIYESGKYKRYKK